MYLAFWLTLEVTIIVGQSVSSKGLRLILQEAEAKEDKDKVEESNRISTTILTQTPNPVLLFKGDCLFSGKKFFITK